jgi:transcription elongation factor Elf1
MAVCCPRCGERSLVELGTTRYSVILHCRACDGVIVERRP